VRITDDQAAYEPLLRAGATHETVTTTSVADVVTTLERIAAAGSSLE
jgi:hypothetical protein